jgi:hypothetical protein
MLARTHRVLDHVSNPMKVVNLAALMVVFAVFHRPTSWLLLTAILAGAIDVTYPHLKRRVGLPDWEPNEAYITKLNRRYRTGNETNDGTREGTPPSSRGQL